METKEIINAIITRENVAAGTFARNIGVHPTQIYDLQRGKVKAISAKLANKVISIYPHYSFQWLTTGEGEMLNTSGMSELSNNESKGVVPEPNVSDDRLAAFKSMYEELKERYNKLEEREAQLMSQLQQKDDQISQLLEILSGRKSNVG